MKSGANGANEVLGNSKTKTIRDSASKYWCFTLNNWTDAEYSIVESGANNSCEKYIIGKEIGEQGTPHLQCFIILKERLRFSQVIKIFGKRIHLTEKYKESTPKQCIDYCSKDGDFIQKGCELELGIKRIIPGLITELRPFQKDILGILRTPTENAKTPPVLWIYDEVGQLGKTQFLKYCFAYYNIPFSYGGKDGDIINLVFNNKKYCLEDEAPALIFNFSRDVKAHKIPYRSMEQVSDGCVSNTKFECGCFIMPKCPRVCVFANCLPDKSRLTDSRWDIRTIDSVTFELKTWEENGEVVVNPLDVQ